jgi:hypothetical protein
VDEVERLMQLFTSRADSPALARVDVLLDLKRHRDPRIVPFLLRVLLNGDESSAVRIDVVKHMAGAQLEVNERPTVAQAIAEVLVEGGHAALRLEAAMVLGCFADIGGIPAALGSVALDARESVDLRFSAFTSLERASGTRESVSVVRKLTSDEILGRSARALLASWRIEP